MADPKIDAVNDLIESGVREQQYSDGSRTVFRSLDELQAIRQDIGRRAAPGKPRKRQIRIRTSSGF